MSRDPTTGDVVVESEEDALQVLEAIEAGTEDELPDAGDYLADLAEQSLEQGLDRVPTVDDETPVVGEYPDWDPDETEIITCTIADAPYKGRKFASAQAARSVIEAEWGRILEANYVPGRAFFRVKKQVKS